MKQVKSYFDIVPTWLIILINSILAIMLSIPTIYAVINIVGMFGIPSDLEGKLVGTGIFIAEAIFINQINSTVYKIKCKKDSIIPDKLNVETGAVRLLLIIGVIILSFIIACVIDNVIVL
jgi:hypothetical protein